MSKYLKFEDISSPNKKTKDFRIWHTETNVFLGFINWKSGWRRYVFTPPGDCVYDCGCLKGITDFISGLMKERADRLVELIKNS